MDIVFISTYLSPHQEELCGELFRQSGGRFTFIATKDTPKMRLELGYPNLNDEYPFVFKTYTDAENLDKAKQRILECDVLIIGSAQDDMISNRLRRKKLTFKYSERFFKTQFTPRNLLHRVASMYLHLIRFQNRNYYMLCASAYTARDCNLFGCFRGRMLKWGYFPPFRKENSIAKLIESKDPSRIVWAGRLIDFKRPCDALKVAQLLKRDGRDFHLEMIGTGNMIDELQNMIEEMDISDRVTMRGALPNEDLRSELRNASIFLFTSDRQEGWGAVLNEAMNAGCAVVASSEAGATPYLIENGVNGVTYETGNIDALYHEVHRLLDGPDLRRKYSQNAYRTIEAEWNAKNAVRKLLAICRELESSSSVTFPESGVCSEAPII